jgi:hypothetical protein
MVTIRLGELSSMYEEPLISARALTTLLFKSGSVNLQSEKLNVPGKP